MSGVKLNLGQNESYSDPDFLLFQVDQLIDQKDTNFHVLK